MVADTEIMKTAPKSLLLAVTFLNTVAAVTDKSAAANVRMSRPVQGVFLNGFFLSLGLIDVGVMIQPFLLRPQRAAHLSIHGSS